MDGTIESIRKQIELLKIEQSQFNLDTIKNKYGLVEEFEREI